MTVFPVFSGKHCAAAAISIQFLHWIHIHKSVYLHSKCHPKNFHSAHYTFWKFTVSTVNFKIILFVYQSVSRISESLSFCFFIVNVLFCFLCIFSILFLVKHFRVYSISTSSNVCWMNLILTKCRSCRIMNVFQIGVNSQIFSVQSRKTRFMIGLTNIFSMIMTTRTRLNSFQFHFQFLFLCHFHQWEEAKTVGKRTKSHLVGSKTSFQNLCSVQIE